MLLSSPSGAGKTSLVQAALIPVLEEEGFRVLPVMRPGLLARDVAQLRGCGANRYVLSLLLSLERELPEAEQTPLAELAGLSLAGYLDRLAAAPEDGWHGDVLIFDQFEEVLTVDPTDRDAKLAFFEQVGQALRDRNRWALFCHARGVRRRLDPYLRPIPARFDKGRRYRLDLLGRTRPARPCKARRRPGPGRGLHRRGRPQAGRRPAPGAGAAARRDDGRNAGPVHRAGAVAGGLPAAVGRPGPR